MWGTFEAWDCVPIGFFENVYGTVDPSPEIMEKVHSYGIENPFLDVVDNETMYVVFGANNKMQESYETYVEEHTQQDVDLVVVKEYHNKKICRVNSCSLKEIYDFSNVSDSGRIIGTYNIKCKNEALIFNGNMHIAEKNGFAQNTYIEIRDAETSEYELYYVKQTEAGDFKKTDDNYYSNLNAEIDLPIFYDESDEIYIIIEYKGEVCRQRLEI